MNKPLTRNSSAEELMNYFNEVINKRFKGESLPVDLEDVWRLGFFTKAEAVKKMLNTKEYYYEEDYLEAINKVQHMDEYGNPLRNYQISITCLVYLILSKYLPGRIMFEGVKTVRDIKILR